VNSGLAHQPGKIPEPEWSPIRAAALDGQLDEENIMFQKILTVALVGAALASAACNTVRGAAKDVNSVANCTENAINGSQRC
jgi:predicted small secreted protein